MITEMFFQKQLKRTEKLLKALYKVWEEFCVRAGCQLDERELGETGAGERGGRVTGGPEAVDCETEQSDTSPI